MGLDVPGWAQEAYFHQSGADHEYTTPSLPKISAGIGDTITALSDAVQDVDRVLNGSTSADDALSNLKRTLVFHLERLQMVHQLLEWSVGRER